MVGTSEELLDVDIFKYKQIVLLALNSWNLLIKTLKLFTCIPELLSQQVQWSALFKPHSDCQRKSDF